MSFDIFVDAFRDGAPASIPRDAVRATFGRFVSDVSRDCWQVRYDKANFCDVHLTVDDADPTKINGFMISGPCANMRLWDALTDILKLGHVVLHFEGRIALVAKPSSIRHLPEEMLEIFGHPRCVSTGQEITAAIEEA